jgi:transposase IS66 family protein
MSAALAAPHDEARQAVHSAAAKNVDETSWKQAGRTCWLWAAATATVAFFVIPTRRNFAGLQALLGEMIQGLSVVTRWSAYNQLPLHLRQICWAHTIRTQSTIRSVARCLLGPIPLPLARLSTASATPRARVSARSLRRRSRAGRSSRDPE